MTESAARPVRGRYRLGADYFEKEFTENAELEFEKARKLHLIGKESKAFAAPLPLSLDSRSSTIRYEKMDAEGESIRYPFLRSTQRPGRVGSVGPLFEDLGRALATIHAELELSNRTAWHAPAGLESRYAETLSDAVTRSSGVFLHGDFGFSNVYVTSSPDVGSDQHRIWIIDPSPNYFMTWSTDCFGPAEVDIANFIACMRGLFPMRLQFDRDWASAAQLLDRFVSGYQSRSDAPVDHDLLNALVEVTLAQYLQYRFSNRIIRALATRLVSARRRVTEFSTVLGKAAHRND